MDKTTFNARLQKIAIKDHPDYRPFQCHGYPLDADVFIIGHNPANPGLPNWWNFWDAETGFDFDRFESANQKNRDKKSVTRKSIEFLIEGLGSLKWVETNLYAIAAKKKKHLKKIDKDHSSLDLLLEACHPKAIFIHDEVVCAYISEKTGGVDLSIGFMTPIELTLNDYTTVCYPLRKHLASKEAREEIISAYMIVLGQQIRQRLERG